MVTIKIKTDNAAFEPAPEIEIARMLRKLADYIERGQTGKFTLRDSNGNSVGIAHVPYGF